MALDSAFVAVVVFVVDPAKADLAFVVEPVEADLESVVESVETVEPAEVDFGIAAALVEAVEPGTAAVAVLAFDTVAVVPDTVAVAEFGQDNVAEVMELEVDRVVAAAIGPDIVAHDRLLVVAVVSVLNTVVAKDAPVANIVDSCTVADIVTGTAE